METAQAATEEALYANLPETRADKPPGYPADDGDAPIRYSDADGKAPEDIIIRGKIIPVLLYKQT